MKSYKHSRHDARRISISSIPCQDQIIMVISEIYKHSFLILCITKSNKNKIDYLN